MYHDYRWNLLVAMIRSELTGLSDAELAACERNRDKLVVLLKTKFNVTTQEADGAVRYYERRLARTTAGIWAFVSTPALQEECAKSAPATSMPEAAQVVPNP